MEYFIEYDAVCDWYVKYTKSIKNDQIYYTKQAMMYYYGKSNIPRIKHVRMAKTKRKILLPSLRKTNR